MSGEEIGEEELMVLFEAARWAPSSYNNQPWRILYARRGTPHWQAFFDLMVPQNQVWTKNAAALLVFVSKTTFDFNGKPYPTHSFDTGAAWANLRCKAGSKATSFTACRASTTIRPRRRWPSQTVFVSRPWPPSAGRARKKTYRLRIRNAKRLASERNLARSCVRGILPGNVDPALF